MYAVTCHLGPKNQQNFVRYKHEFIVTVIVIAEFDCMLKKNYYKMLNLNRKMAKFKCLEDLLCEKVRPRGTSNYST